MRTISPHWEKVVARHMLRTGRYQKYALYECGRKSLGREMGKRLAFHMGDYTKAQTKPHTRITAGLKLGYTFYRLLPVDDLRKLHDPVPDSPWLKGYDLMPKGIPACDLAAFNLYLELVVKVSPCPFPLLVRRGLWENGAWRTLAKQSDLWGEF